MNSRTRITIVFVATLIGASLGLAIGIWAKQHDKNLYSFILGGAFLGFVEALIQTAVMSMFRDKEGFVEEDEVVQAERGLTPDEEALYGDTGEKVSPIPTNATTSFPPPFSGDFLYLRF